MSSRLPSVGSQEILLLVCGGVIALLSVSGPGANLFGVLIGLFIISMVIRTCRNLRSWARREGYELISMSGIGMFAGERRRRLLPDRCPMYRIALRASDGAVVQGFVAFASTDFGFKKPILLELDGQTSVKNEPRSFTRELLIDGIINLISIYIIFIGFCSWNEIKTQVLVKAVAMADEFEEADDTELLNQVKFRTSRSYAKLSFILPSYFPDKNFLIKAELEMHGRRSRRLVKSGDIVPLWVDINQPDQSFSVDLEEARPEGTIRSQSGKSLVLMGGIGFLITGYALSLYWRRRILHPNSSDVSPGRT